MTALRQCRKLPAALKRLWPAIAMTVSACSTTPSVEELLARPVPSTSAADRATANRERQKETERFHQRYQQAASGLSDLAARHQAWAELDRAAGLALKSATAELTIYADQATRVDGSNHWILEGRVFAVTKAAPVQTFCADKALIDEADKVVTFESSASMQSPGLTTISSSDATRITYDAKLGVSHVKGPTHSVATPGR